MTTKILQKLLPKRLGIIDANDTEGHVLTGAELNELSDEDFEKVVGQYSVYARVSPEHRFVSSRLGKNKVKSLP